MPNPLEAHARRGAPFTFDPAALKKLVQKLKESIEAEAPAIYAPSFDHAKKDPVEDDIAILATQRVLVFEGLSPQSISRSEARFLTVDRQLPFPQNWNMGYNLYAF